MAKSSSNSSRNNTQEQRIKEKESLIKGLATVLKEHGFTVRREKLRSGPGWKVVSGSCRVNTEKLIFVDPRMSLEEQILFLSGRAKDAGIATDKLPGSHAVEESRELNQPDKQAA